MSFVSFVKLKGDARNQFRQGILESLGLIDFSFEKRIKNVVIKPNLCYYWDHTTGQTTHPRFVAALIDVLREKISEDVCVAIVESDASAMKCDKAFRILGYEKLAEKCNVDLVNLTTDDYEVVETNCKDLNFHLRLPISIKRADLKINVTKIKYSYENLKITCALKNIFGCNPNPRKFRYHPWIDETIVALNKIMRFDLNLIDAYAVSGIQPRRLGLLMASQDPVAIDVAAAKIAGVNPKKVGYIELARKEGVGSSSFIEKGEPLVYFARRYPRRGIRSGLLIKAYKAALSLGLGRRLGVN